MSYQHILVPVDGSEISMAAVKHAVDLAKLHQSKISFISLITEDPFNNADFYSVGSSIMKEYFQQAKANAQEALRLAQEIAHVADLTSITQVVEGNVSAEQVVDYATHHHIDLIVVGSHGRKGFKKMMLGSFAQDVLASAHLPVLVIK